MAPSRIALALFLAGTACASERYFGYSQQSEVLAPGQRELEASATWRAGREEYYRRLDTRLELEAGLADQLQGSFYLNFKQVTAYDSTTGGNTTSSDLDGVSLELKRRFSDSATATLGSALYVEGTLNSEESELEIKAIVDKQLTAHDTVVGNLVWEGEWDNAHTAHPEHALIATLGWSHRLGSGWSAGLELMASNVLEWEAEEAEYEHEAGALYGGPVVHYANEGFWATLTALPQLTALKKEEGAEGRLELNEYERVQVRLLVGCHF